MGYMIMPVYNTDQPVGQGEINQAEDVKLIQALLSELTHATGGTWGPTTPLAMNGQFDSNTRDWILAFQRRMNSANPGALVEDGKVHPMRVQGSRDWSTKFASGRTSTLWAMNDMLRRKARNAHQQLGMRLGLREAMPS